MRPSQFEPLDIDGYQHHCPQCEDPHPTLRRRDGAVAESLTALFAVKDGEIHITGIAQCDRCDWEKKFTIGP